MEENMGSLKLFASSIFKGPKILKWRTPYKYLDRFEMEC